MVVLTEVSKWYLNQTRILNQVSLELKKGDFLYVVGGSGAGKSTLLRLLATEETPSMGVVSLFGYDLETMPSTTLRGIRQCIGYIPQNVRLVPDLTVYDNVALSLSLAKHRVLFSQPSLQSTSQAVEGSSVQLSSQSSLHSSGHSLGQYKAHFQAKISELLNRLGLESKRFKLAGSLSGGEAQRVAVARALVRSPELIVADEPTGAQDRDFTWSLMDLFLKANAKGTTVVIATHDREIVRRVRKRCAILQGGMISVEENLCIY